jgi:hypothetical protein
LANGLGVEAEEASDVTQATAAKFAGLDGSVTPPILFAQRVAKGTHGLFDSRWVRGHGTIPREVLKTELGSDLLPGNPYAKIPI